MAGILENPPVLQQPFAFNGDKNTIPLSATGDQRASLQEGFPPVTSQSILKGGIPPERKDFNGLGNLLSSMYFYLQNGGQFTFNPDVSNAIGGYPAGAILTYTDSSTNKSYQVISLINNNTFNFVAEPSYIDGAKWAKAYVDTDPNQLNYTDITNCIVSAPNNIKYELNEGILTLKSGSKLYDAKGNSVTLNSDLTYTMTFTHRILCYALVTKKSNQIILIAYNDPNLTFTENTVMYKTEECWLPFAMATRDVAGKSSIDQVFNAFGGIGSTYFLLPDVKFLFANGYNDDGSVKNIEWTSDKVYTATRTWKPSALQSWVIAFDNGHYYLLTLNGYFVQEDAPTTTIDYTLWYKPSLRKTYYLAASGSDWKESLGAFICKDTKVIQEVSNFNTRTPFVAFDENDFNPRFDNRMQVVNTLPASPEKDIFYFCTNA